MEHNQNILNLIIKAQYTVLTQEEANTLQQALLLKNDMQNLGKPLNDDEKAMLKALKKTVSQEDIKKLATGNNGKRESSYLSWAQITKALTENLGKENWSMTDLTEESVTKVENDKGYLVHVTVSLFGGKIVETMSLPVMDSGNNPITLEPYDYTTKYGTKTVEGIDSFNLYKNYQRCFVKAIAVATGLGIELYTGEDLPSDNDGDEEGTKTPTEQPKKTLKGGLKKPNTSNASNDSDAPATEETTDTEASQTGKTGLKKKLNKRSAPAGEEEESF